MNLRRDLFHFRRPARTIGEVCRRRNTRVQAAAIAAALAAAAAAIWSVAQLAPAAAIQPPTMAAMLPPGALLSIESPDFASLLHDWQSSPEQAAWLKSDNYGVFSRSRLFGRLQDAQQEFAAAAGLNPDAAFLDEIAGSRSIFAWYGIGKLEFLYITRLPPGKAEQTRLLQSRSSFSPRQVGAATFYVRTRSAAPDQDASPGAPANAQLDTPPNPQGESGTSASRTVAFAVSGDYLLLATREDLMANALALMNHASSDSLATEPWFTDVTRAAAPASSAPALRMALDLDRIVKTPYFRSYWLPQNITEMKQYRAALCDLFRESTQMREERVLLPRSPAAGPPPPDLAALAALVPPGVGVYRALATAGTDPALAALDEKLIRRGATPYQDDRYAPSADVSAEDRDDTSPAVSDSDSDPDAGAPPASNLTSSDFEVRIDAPPLVPAAAAVPERLPALRVQLAAANVTALMTLDSNQPSSTAPRTAAVWAPIHSAVVLRAANSWDEPAIEAAVRSDLGAQLTASGLGLVWTPVSAPAGRYASLGQLRPLHLAVRGQLLLLSDDASLMDAMLTRLQAAPPAPVPATLLARFDHDASAAPFARLANLLDRTSQAADARRLQTGSSAAPPPPFFAGNVASLSHAFAALQSESVLERPDGAIVRQTVTYTWQR